MKTRQFQSQLISFFWSYVYLPFYHYHSRSSIGVVGQSLLRCWLASSPAPAPTVYSLPPSPSLPARAGAAITGRLPTSRTTRRAPPAVLCPPVRPPGASPCLAHQSVTAPCKFGVGDLKPCQVWCNLPSTSLVQFAIDTFFFFF